MEVVHDIQIKLTLDEDVQRGLPEGFLKLSADGRTGKIQVVYVGVSVSEPVAHTKVYDDLIVVDTAEDGSFCGLEALAPPMRLATEAPAFLRMALDSKQKELLLTAASTACEFWMNWQKILKSVTHEDGPEKLAARNPNEAWNTELLTC